MRTFAAVILCVWVCLALPLAVALLIIGGAAWTAIVIIDWAIFHALVWLSRHDLRKTLRGHRA